MKIAILGSGGQLGSEFKCLMSHDNNYVFLGSNELDITNKDDLADFFKFGDYDLIINCAAFTSVDEAEEEIDLAYSINEEGVKNIVKVCESYDMKLIHFSTDYVFNGNKNEPYTESDETEPIGVYGNSKRSGELAISKSNVSALIIRTAWLYSTFGNNFLKTILNAGLKKDSINVVSDQLGSPTYSRDLAEACIKIISNLKTWPNHPTIYHFCNDGSCSWFDMADFILKYKSIHCEVKPIPSSEYKTRVQRPKYSVLNNEKIKKDFDLSVPNYLESIKRCLDNV